MIQLIESIENWQNKTAAEITAELNEKNIPFIDQQQYTWAGVALIAGPQGAEALRLALDANGMGWAVHQLGGSGLQLSNDLVQQALLGFAAADVPGCSELAAAGKRLISKAEQAGIGTAEESVVANFLASMQLQSIRKQKKDAAVARYNAYIAAIDTWNGVSEEPIL